MSSDADTQRAFDRLVSLLHDVQRGDYYASDLAQSLLCMLTPEALRGLAEEQRETEGGSK